MAKPKKAKHRKLDDEAVEMTFPASDTPARGGATGTEPPRRPPDRQAPELSKEDIEEARRGSATEDERG
jgi:hypothetical protein